MRSFVTSCLTILLFSIRAFSQHEDEPVKRFPAHEQVFSNPVRVPLVQKNPLVQPRITTAVTPWSTIKVNQSANVEPQNEPYVAVNPLDRDNIVCVYRDFRLGGGENNTTAIRSIGIATTTDAGATWSETWAHYGTQNRYSDPGVATDALGNFYVLSLNSNTTGTFDFNTALYTVQVSFDKGLSWSAGAPTDLPMGFHDKELLAIDNSPESPYYGTIYVSGNGPNGHYVVHSSDGVTWTPPVLIQGFYVTPSVGPKGELYIEQFNYDSIRVMHSLDGGATFANAAVSGQFIPGSVQLNGFMNSIGMVSAPVDLSQSPRRGTVYCVWQSLVNGDGDLYCASSKDSGVTWTKGVRINNDPIGNGADQFHSWSTVDDSGFVDVIFQDRRDDPANIYANAYFAQSRDGGKTFKNFRITPVSYDPSISPGPDARYGDYSGISAAQGRIVPIWNDTRLGDQDIYIALIDQDQAGVISGIVFSDCNGDGVRQPEDSTVAGVAVVLAHDGGTDTAWTGANGKYVFDGVFSGSYSVTVTDFQTYPAGHAPHAIALSAAQHSDNNDFGIQRSPTGILPGWNLVSLPRETDRAPSASIFTAGVSGGPFGFPGRYVSVDSIASGYGYWLKAECEVARTLSGDTLQTATIDLRQGWNLVGALGVPFVASAATTIPSGISNLVFTGYNPGSGYATASSLVPGQGYWLKAVAAGKLVLDAGAAMGLPKSGAVQGTENGLSHFVLSDHFSHSSVLLASQRVQSDLSRYELPPVPPADGADVRFNSQRSMDVMYPGELQPHVVKVQGFKGLVTIHWTIAGNEKYILETLSGRASLEGSGETTMDAADLESVSLIASHADGRTPAQFVLHQNYPDPFNPTTTIKYELPEQLHVTLTVVDVLGREVARLVNEEEPAGSYSVPFDAGALSSGIYFYRVEAGKYLQTRKMVVMK